MSAGVVDISDKLEYAPIIVDKSLLVFDCTRRNRCKAKFNGIAKKASLDIDNLRFSLSRFAHWLSKKYERFLTPVIDSMRTASLHRLHF